MPYAKIRTQGVVLEPQASAGALNGELYRNSDNANAFTDKTTGGTNTPVGAAAADSLFTKIKKNNSGVSIADGVTVSLKSDGNIMAADADHAEGQKVIGIASGVIANNSFGTVKLFYPNIANAVAGLSFTPAQDIYLNDTGATRGFTNNIGSLTGGNDTIVQVGYADLPSNSDSGSATDLIAFSLLTSRP